MKRNYRGLFEQNVETGKADDVCAIVYTSGTTGATQGSYPHLQDDEGGCRLSTYVSISWHENDNVVPYLPPAWMTEQ